MAVVLSGGGEAIVHGRAGKARRTKLQANSLLMIEAGELHLIKNTGRRSLSTLNFYVPPAYDRVGDVKDK